MTSNGFTVAAHLLLFKTPLAAETSVIFQMKSVIIRSLLAHWLGSHRVQGCVFFHLFLSPVFLHPPSLCLFTLSSLFPSLSPFFPPLPLLPFSLLMAGSHWHLTVSGIKAGEKLPGRHTACCVTGAKLSPSHPLLGLCIIKRHHLHRGTAVTHAVHRCSIH